MSVGPGAVVSTQYVPALRLHPSLHILRVVHNQPLLLTVAAAASICRAGTGLAQDAAEFVAHELLAVLVLKVIATAPS